MRIFWQLLVIGIFLTGSALGQDPRVSPTPVDDVVKISTNLIQIDVSATDKKGNPIRDLRAEEIEIYENGKKQVVSNFSFVSGMHTSPTKPSKPAKDQIPQPIIPTSRPDPARVRRTIALVVDDLGLSFNSIFWVKQALRKYVNEQVQEGDLIAIIRTAGGMGALQQFTTDKRQLHQVIDDLKFSTQGRGRISTFEPITAVLKNQVGGDNAMELQRQAAQDYEFEREAAAFRSSVFVNGTLGAINFVVRGMEKMPGRKSIVLLSDGIAFFDSSGRGIGQAGPLREAMRRLVDQANRAAVVIHTVGARGLESPGAQAMDDWTAPNFSQQLQDRENEFSDSQDGLRHLAAETGGLAFVNSNDINYGLGRVMDDQSYYLIGYEPDEATFDPKRQKFNRIEIKVNRPDVVVRYRSGFLGVTDDQIKQTVIPGAQAMENALTSPFAVDDIRLRLHTVFTTDNKRRLWVKSYMHIDANNLTFSTLPNGDKKATFEVVALNFGDNGTIADQMARQFTLTIPAAAYERSLHTGLVYQYAFEAKKPGGYQYRVALRDLATEKVGSASQFITVPNMKRGKLTLSGVALESMPKTDWDKLMAGTVSYAEVSKKIDAQTVTALRQFKQGEVMRYALQIFDAKPQTSLVGQIKIFRSGELFYEGKPGPITAANPNDIQYTGGMILGKDMGAGDYILQIQVWESDKPGRAATQFVEYEIVE